MADGVITVVGTGTAPGAGAVDAGAALVVGAARHLDAAELPPGAERWVLGPLAPALDAIARYVAQDRPVTVLASGDPGFFGIVRALGERFGPAALDVRPSSPSVAVAFARLGLTWDDAVVVSAHGRDLRTAVNVCRAHPKAAVLTGPGAGPAELGAELARADADRTLVVGSALGTGAESVVHVTPREAAAREWPDGGSVVLCLAPAGRLPAAAPRTVAGPAPAPAGWALPEEEFAHRDSMVTKFEVRALVLARLGPRTGELVWDVGAGSGSVAVECARFGAAVVAVERDADGVARVRANAAAHGVDVRAVHGSAPAALAELPDPDAVFVGGGGPDLEAIVTECARRARRTVVVTLASLDRVPAVRRALLAAGRAADGLLLQSSRLAPLPDTSTRLSPTNPVFVLWSTRPDAPDPAPPPAGDATEGTHPTPTHPAGAPPPPAGSRPVTTPHGNDSQGPEPAPQGTRQAVRPSTDHRTSATGPSGAEQTPQGARGTAWAPATGESGRDKEVIT
ncbi:precorrin-6Y C5,15-methyltransferase (decarboxylating) [Actinacidiphila rubida]|uniref:Precorrin-6Y C5,15-methyltransferase (Decarboxylating) n=1 Tax=Actinacidiphila rubida TaxID=310780 RepID=A0A1H8SAY4_9ACTN|nr:precorrin-6Y C5,15-methyltransferase (decarboxylating) [Actinacidiphila rubida]